VTEQGYPPRQPGYPGRQGRSRAPHAPRKTGWQVIEAFDDSVGSESDLPPWAVPGGIEPLRPARRPPRAHDRGQAREPAGVDDSGAYPAADPAEPVQRRRLAGRSRAAAARRRRSKRRLETWGGGALVIVVLVAGGLWLTRSHAPKSQFVTTLQRGEVKSVPNACKILGATELQALLKRTPNRVQPFTAQVHSQCTYTVDARPIFRLLSLTVQAFPPSLTAPGSGSATANALYSFGLERTGLTKPSKGTAQPPAKITTIRGLGSEAFSAAQIFHTGMLTDRVTVWIRYRNVLIDVSLMGEASGGFGPVTNAELGNGALSAARIALAAVKTEPTAG
jgi:hypothetical protein